MAYIWVGENENENVEEETIKKWLNSCVLCTNYMIDQNIFWPSHNIVRFISYTEVLSSRTKAENITLPWEWTAGLMNSWVEAGATYWD